MRQTRIEVNMLLLEHVVRGAAMLEHSNHLVLSQLHLSLGEIEWLSLGQKQSVKGPVQSQSLRELFRPPSLTVSWS